uniref:uncharacterized protein LOC109952413 n=1 Tax=Monopterus albus TaxID=43700 RepID=UPI0009B3A01E|nr:uncharacterized protein LOC109952413 [Monopterus albus]
MDVESLQKSGRRRGSCLDVFLVMSIIVLFVAVTAVAAGGVIVVMDLQSKLMDLQSKAIKVDHNHDPLTSDSAYKMQNVAYLEAITNGLNKLENSTMQWDTVPYGAGQSVGTNFIFKKTQHTLMPKQAGTYFMYINLNLTCIFRCRAGLLTVHVGDKLTCEVELPDSTNSKPVSKKCWTVSRLDEKELLTQMTVPKEGLENWQLNSSELGMFLAD